MNAASLMYFYGCCIIASGLYRFFSAEGGQAGLWFGLVMGFVALTSASLFRLSKLLAGHVTAWLAITFVGGWFFYEALIKKGWWDAEPRLLLILALSLCVAAVLPAISLRSRNKR